VQRRALSPACWVIGVVVDAERRRGPQMAMERDHAQPPTRREKKDEPR
jgi:hypothetical protein